MKNRSVDTISLHIEGPWGRGHVAEARTYLQLGKGHMSRKDVAEQQTTGTSIRTTYDCVVRTQTLTDVSRHSNAGFCEIEARRGHWNSNIWTFAITIIIFQVVHNLVQAWLV